MFNDNIENIENHHDVEHILDSIIYLFENAKFIID